MFIASYIISMVILDLDFGLNSLFFHIRTACYISERLKLVLASTLFDLSFCITYILQGLVI